MKINKFQKQISSKNVKTKKNKYENYQNKASLMPNFWFRCGQIIFCIINGFNLHVSFLKSDLSNLRGLINEITFIKDFHSLGWLTIVCLHETLGFSLILLVSANFTYRRIILTILVFFLLISLYRILQIRSLCKITFILKIRLWYVDMIINVEA